LDSCVPFCLVTVARCGAAHARLGVRMVSQCGNCWRSWLRRVKAPCVPRECACACGSRVHMVLHGRLVIKTFLVGRVGGMKNHESGTGSAIAKFKLLLCSGQCQVFWLTGALGHVSRTSEILSHKSSC